MESAPRAAEFETILASLEGLTSHQIADRLKTIVPTDDAEAFAVLVDGLSSDAVRFLAARALLRLAPVSQGTGDASAA